MTIPTDKLRHFFGGAVFAMLVTRGAMWVIPFWYAVWLGLVLTAALGAYKEWVYDKARPATHTVDGWDFRATLFGGVVGVIVASMIGEHHGP